MKALKDFVTKNKLLVSITGAVTMCTFMVFSIIAFAIGGTGSAPANTEDSTTTNKLVADNTTENNTDDTLPPYTGESEEAGSETEPNENEEPTTKPPVDPDTLPYEIKVNRAANCLTVYTKDDNGKFTVPFKAITVSCGKNFGDTPLGTYQTIEHYNWRLMNDGTYAQYAYRIVGPILFHSVPYYTQAKNNLEWEEFNKLGSPASLGCVRMTVADAKWLMDNCPIGTRVVIYDDAENPGPLGKPDTIKIPADLATILGIAEADAEILKKWDPTDHDPSNPWHKYSASLMYPATKQITVEVGATMDDILSYFTATDTCGNDITHKIEFSTNFNLQQAGVYHNVTVSITDAIGSHAEVTVIIVVTEKEDESSSEDTTTPTETESESTSEDTTTPTETESESTSEDTTTPTETESESTSEDTTTPTETESESPSESESESTSENESESSSENGSEGSSGNTPTEPIA